MKPRPTIDVSPLPTFAFGHRDPMWWGVMLLIAIEGMTVALLLVSWFYIRSVVPSGQSDYRAHLPIMAATIGTVLLLASGFTNHLLNRCAEKMDLRGTRFWLIVTTLLGLGFTIARGFELAHVNFRWDANGFASVYWTLLGLNLFHAGGGVVENAVLIALLFIGPVEKKLMPDLKLDGNYWYFVVASWVVLYAVIYLGPLLGH